MPALLILFLLLMASLLQRMAKKRSSTQQIPEMSKPSLLSVALQELIGTAGGVYLSLLLLISFLQIDIPGSILFMGMTIEPLALISLILAFVQPFIIKFFEMFKRRI